MHRALLVKWAMVVVGAAIAAAQQPPSKPPGQPPNQPPLSSTRPPEDNEKGLRPLTPEEIPPNLNFYAMDPLYKAGTRLAGRPSVFANPSIADSSPSSRKAAGST